MTNVRGTTRLSKIRRAKASKRSRAKVVFRIVGLMKLTHLAALRESSPGSPSKSDMARKIKVSRQAIHRFEAGQTGISPDKVKAYARAIGADEHLVWRMFYLSALSFHREQVDRISAIVKGHPGKAARSTEFQPA